MIYDKFVSLVIPLGPSDTARELAGLLTAIKAEIALGFADIEIVLVDYGVRFDIASVNVDDELRTDCYLIKLSQTAIWDQAALAGIERTNGDAALILDAALATRMGVVKEMFSSADDGADIVGLRSTSQRGDRRSLSRELFFTTLRLFGERGVSRHDRREFLISRRAINWLVRDVSAFWYLNEALASSGFSTSWVSVDFSGGSSRPNEVAGDLAWGMLARSPRVLRRFSAYVLGALLSVVLLATLNALTVRFFGVDLLGEQQANVPGWAYLVIFMSIGLTAIATLLHVIIMIQLVVLEQVRERPRYIIEYFGRL